MIGNILDEVRINSHNQKSDRNLSSLWSDDRARASLPGEARREGLSSNSESSSTYHMICRAAVSCECSGSSSIIAIACLSNLVIAVPGVQNGSRYVLQFLPDRRYRR